MAPSLRGFADPSTTGIKSRREIGGRQCRKRADGKKIEARRLRRHFSGGGDDRLKLFSGRLCVSQTTQLLSFEMSDGSSRREYESFLPVPIQPEIWTEIRVRGHAGVLERRPILGVDISAGGIEDQSYVVGLQVWEQPGDAL